MTDQDLKVSLFDDPDQEGMRRDLTAFFGPKAERYLAIYERMRKRRHRRRFAPLSWNWGTFLLGFVWFFYRRQPVMALIYIGSLGVADAIWPPLGGGVAMAFNIKSKLFYVNRGVKCIARAEALGLEGEERLAYLRRKGGRSWLGGGIALIVMLLLIFASMASLFHQRY